MVMETSDSETFRKVVNGAHLATPDGTPLVWVLKSLRVRGASQVRGTNFTTHVVKRAAREGVPLGLYGTLKAGCSEVRRVY
jgi:N-acetylglucosaminyldiphosphoundecaprenol N-acetyl-beta-D-mannosaminyltransferase